MTKLEPFLMDLGWRGLLRDKTPEAEEPDFSRHPRLYVGFDPTATSLHAGSLIPLTGMDRFRRRGGQIIVVMGGATGMIGDPSFKDQERALQSAEVVAERIEKLQQQVAAFFARTEGPAPIFVNNADWYREMDVITFLRDVGKHFSVNQMLLRDSVRTRIEGRDQGISFTEFSYQLLQAYDYLHLFTELGCTWQMGASDQWGNIVSGIDLIRRKTGQTAHAITLPLLTNSEGKKYGKSESGAVWLDPDQTSPYAFYQFWFNSADADTPQFLRWLTDLDRGAIEALAAQPAHERAGQKRLAYLLTARVHGEPLATLAEQASEVIFSNRFEQLNTGVIGMLSGAVPTFNASSAPECSAMDALTALRATKSRSEARRLVAQKAVSANGVLITDVEESLVSKADGRAALILAVGKNRRFLVRW